MLPNVFKKRVIIYLFLLVYAWINSGKLKITTVTFEGGGD